MCSTASQCERPSPPSASTETSASTARRDGQLRLATYNTSLYSDQVQSNPEAYYYARGQKIRIKDEPSVNQFYGLTGADGDMRQRD